MASGREWWRGGALYQVYPRSFADSNGDGIGDLKGITQKLDYIAALGVDGVWLSPFFTSPMADFGYDVADYKNVDPIFGTLADFDAMLDGLHRRELKLIIDFVLNHTSEQHPWFQESRKGRDNPKSDWYVWTDPKPDGTPPNNWLSVFGGSAWQFDPGRGQYYYHQFLKEQPDLNILNPEVREELLGIAKWWLERGIDGFRLDALPHCIHDAQLRDNPPRPVLPSQDGKTVIHPYAMQWHMYDKSRPEMIPFLKEFRALTEKYPGSMMVAEVNDDKTVETTIAYTDGPEMLHTAYDFSLLMHEYSAAHIRQKVADFFATPHGAWPSWAFSNHDSIRVASRWAVDGKPSPLQEKMLLALLASLRGSCFIYQGEELGLTEAAIPPEKRKDPGIGATGTGRDGCRTPMPWDGAQINAGFTTAAEPWLPVPHEHLEKSVARQEKDPDSTLNFTRNFLKWRKSVPALLTGGIRFINARHPLLVFTRDIGPDAVLCIFNLGLEESSFTLPAGCADMTGHGLPFTRNGDSLALPAFGGYFGGTISPA